jgi:tRNA threonylcarbamoyl adenosine modification protein YeaZ
MSAIPAVPGPVLAIDTATHHSVVALAPADGPIRASVEDVGRRHGPTLLDQLDRVLVEAGVRHADIALIVAGTGPGSFTGLRVGLATAKTLAYVTGARVVGVTSTDALRRAAVDAAVAGPQAIVVLPAGAHDHYLATADAVPELVAPGTLLSALAGREAIAIGVGPEVAGVEAVQRGEVALAGLPTALVALGLVAALADAGDPATLIPTYIALPRGIATEDAGWSPDLQPA